MPRRVNPIVLLGLIAVLVLSLAILAVARPGGGDAGGGGGSGSDALGVAMGQIGTPYGYGTDGGGTFSCTGLVRHALRAAGVDPNAPWDHMAYLGVYPTVSEPQPGDVVVYPDGVAMYAGNDQVVMANEVDQVVGTYGMNEVGTPVGFARPYGGTLAPEASDPAALDPALDPAAADPALAEPLPADPVAIDPMADPAAVDPMFDPVEAEFDQTAAEPILEDPALAEPLPADPAAVDPMML